MILNLAISLEKKIKILAQKSLLGPAVAGHRAGAMLQEDTLPKKLLLGSKMCSGCLPSSSGTPSTALSAAAGHSLVDAGDQLPTNPSGHQLHGVSVGVTGFRRTSA